MTTIEHRLPRTGAPRLPWTRRVLAALTANPYLRLLATLIVIAASAMLLAVGIVLVLDVVVPLVFGDELRALAALLPG